MVNTYVKVARIGPSRHRAFTQRGHRKIGGLVSQGIPFHRALHDVQMRPHSNKHSSILGRYSGSGGSYKSDLRDIVELLEFVSGAFTVIGVLSLFATYDFTIWGLFAVGGYLLFWEFVSAAFSTVQKKLPTPLGVFVQIIEEIVEILG